MFSPQEILARPYEIWLKESESSFCHSFLGNNRPRRYLRIYSYWQKISPEFYLPQTAISDNLLEAYRSAHYRAGQSHDEITLQVDQYSEPLAQLLAASGHQCAVFITACNPLGVRQSPELNRIACARLRDRLSQYVSISDQVIEGEGFDPFVGWAPEESFLVLGLGLAESRALGKEFHQNALVWADVDAVPRLILLR